MQIQYERNDTILTTDPILYGLACAYAVLGRPTISIQAFRDADEAKQWLAAQGERD